MSPVTIPWSPRLQAYNPSDDSQRPLRRGLAWDLLDADGLLGADGVTVVDPPTATDDEITRVHTPEYVDAVRRYSADPIYATEVRALGFGFVPGMDTVATAGMHEAAADVCGASMTGARTVAAAAGARAFCPAPAGLHHAHAGRASGFCVYNDCALAVRELLDLGVERVAYVDLDAHHGDGVQWMFYDDPRVLCVSVHEFAYGFFPGTGGLEERGVDAGLGATLNVPLPPFAGDVSFLAAVEQVVVPAVRAHRPQVLVTHLGVDVHHADPMAHLQVTLPALERTYATVVDLADEVCDGRLLVIAGGGYNPTSLGRFWALQLGALAGISIGDALPPMWRSAAHTALGVEAPLELREDSQPEVDAAHLQAADRQGLENVAQARALVDG